MIEDTPQPTLADRLGTVQIGLRSDLEISRHTFRNEPCYVVRNPITFHSHDLSTSDYQIFVALDGEKTLGDTFDGLVAAGKLKQEQEEEFYAFTLNLNQLGLLNLPISSGKALYERFQQRRVGQRRAKITGFLFWRVPLFNPDAMLERTMRYFAPLFSRGAFLLWLAMVALCVGILWQRWGDFKEPLQTMLVTKNLAGLWILLVALKVIHEFGHAYLCKFFGGKVPEMGAFFVCFTPCAYVDASAAWGFTDKKQRIAVSLGGMYVESMVAGIALLVWSATGPSLLNSFAHQTFTLASIVTVGFNINPLMRFDGYYVLSDLVEIPNLRQRSVAQLQAVCKRWLLGIRSDILPFSASGRCLLFAYGVGSAIWKLLLVVAVCAGVALKIYILGVVMAAVYGSTVVWGTLSKLIKYLWMSQETEPVRGRAIVLGLVALIGVPMGIAVVPVPKRVEVRGVVVAENETPVFAKSAGFLQRSTIAPGHSAKACATLYVLENFHTRATAAMARAELGHLNLQAECELEEDPGTSAMTRQRAEHIQRTLLESQREVENLSVSLPVGGRVVDCVAISPKGRYVREGEQIATVTSGGWIIRSLANAQDLADTRPRAGQKVRVRLPGVVGEEFSGTVTGVAATGSTKIPSAALTQLGGGTIAVAPDTMTAAEPYFEIIIKLEDAYPAALERGMTARIRLHAPAQALGVQLYRSGLRFLNKLRT